MMYAYKITESCDRSLMGLIRKNLVCSFERREPVLVVENLKLNLTLTLKKKKNMNEWGTHDVFSSPPTAFYLDLDLKIIYFISRETELDN